MLDSVAKWRRIKGLLAQAMELPAARREAFAENHCSDRRLRRELLSMIQAIDPANGFLKTDASLPRTRMYSLKIGEQIGPYRIIEKIGEGGMGAVFKALDERLDRWVAIKTVLHTDLPEAERQRQQQRFLGEMRTLAQLNHPHIVQIYDSGDKDGIPYAVTEFLEGETLDEILRSGPPPIRRVLDIAIGLASGLSAAHQAGIIHRDLKPANIFITPGNLKILDFGIAKPFPLTNISKDRSPEEELLGTPSYMAPEQLSGDICDRRIDIFAFGIILYEMVAGERPFKGSDFFDIQSSILIEEPRPIRELRSDIEPALSRLIERCLHKNLEERIPSADVLSFLLSEMVSNSEPVKSFSDPISPVPLKKRPKNLLSHVLVALLAISLTVLSGILQPESAPPPRQIQLTPFPKDSSPNVSRDGNLLTFLSERDGQSQIRVRQLGTGVERTLATGHGAPSFDSEAHWILFAKQSLNSEGRPKQSLYRVNVLDAKTELYFDQATVGRWSPDDRNLAFVREEWGGQINRWKLGVIATSEVESGKNDNFQILYEAIAPIPHLSWSPDGRDLFAVVENSAQGLGDEVWRIEFGSGEATQLRLDLPAGRISRPTILDRGQSLLIAHSPSLTGYVQSSRLLRYRLRGDDSIARPETELWIPSRVGVVDRWGEGNIVLDTLDISQQLYEFALEEPGSSDHWLVRDHSIDRQPIYAEENDLIFSSNRNGNVDLWIWSRSEQRATPLFPHPADDWDPVLARDGRTLLWSSNRDGALEIYKADLVDSTLQQLTQDRAAENPSISDDGQWVLYSSSHPETSGLRRIRIDGSEDRPVPTDLGRAHPEVSPSGRYALFHDHLIDGQTHVHVVEIETGATTAFQASIRLGNQRIDPAITLGRARWRPDESAIAYLGIDDEGGAALFEQPFDPNHPTSEKRRRIFTPPLNQIPESFAYRSDGRRMVVSLVDRSSSMRAVYFESPQSSSN